MSLYCFKGRCYPQLVLTGVNKYKDKLTPSKTYMPNFSFIKICLKIGAHIHTKHIPIRHIKTNPIIKSKHM